MAKILISPGKYVQGAGELKKLGEAYAKAAAEYLGLTKKVVAPSPLYRVQLSEHYDEAGAEAMVEKLAAAGFTAAIVKTEQ